MPGINYHIGLFGNYFGDRLARQIAARVTASLYTQQPDLITKYINAPHSIAAIDSMARTINLFAKSEARKQLLVKVESDDALSVKPKATATTGQRRHYSSDLTTTPMGLVSEIEDKFAKAVVSGIHATAQELFLKAETVAAGVVVTSMSLEPGYQNYTMSFDTFKAQAANDLRLLIGALDMSAKIDGRESFIEKHEIKSVLQAVMSQILSDKPAFSVGFDLSAEVMGKKKIEQSDLIGAYGIRKEDIFFALVDNINQAVEKAAADTPFNEVVTITTKRVKGEIEY